MGFVLLITSSASSKKFFAKAFRQVKVPEYQTVPLLSVPFSLTKGVKIGVGGVGLEESSSLVSSDPRQIVELSFLFTTATDNVPSLNSSLSPI